LGGISTNAVSTVIMAVWAINGDDGTGVCCCAPGEAILESDTVSTVVGSGTAFRNLDAGLGDGAPAESGSFAMTLSAVVVIIGTVDWNANTGLGYIAESKARLESHTVAASVIG